MKSAGKRSEVTHNKVDRRWGEQLKRKEEAAKKKKNGGEAKQGTEEIGGEGEKERKNGMRTRST